MKTGTIQRVRIDQIKPYWRNPRDNSRAVEKVKRSIEKFGYNQFIAVDKELVIVAGHTRYKALVELGWPEIDVIVTDLSQAEAKKYRIIDNKTSEFAEWTDDLTIELRESDDLAFMQEFFEDKIDLNLNLKDNIELDEDDIAKESDKLDNRFQDQKDTFQDVTCPHCGEDFKVQMNSGKIYGKENRT